MWYTNNQKKNHFIYHHHKIFFNFLFNFISYKIVVILFNKIFVEFYFLKSLFSSFSTSPIESKHMSSSIYITSLCLLLKVVRDNNQNNIKQKTNSKNLDLVIKSSFRGNIFVELKMDLELNNNSFFLKYIYS